MNEKPYSAEYNPKDGITYVMRHGCADWVWADDKSMNDSHAVADILNSAHAAGRATAEAELAALRAKWEALRGECEAWRAADEECGFIVRNNRVMDSRTLTDSTHALEAE